MKKLSTIFLIFLSSCSCFVPYLEREVEFDIDAYHKFKEFEYEKMFPDTPTDRNCVYP